MCISYLFVSSHQNICVTTCGQTVKKGSVVSKHVYQYCKKKSLVLCFNISIGELNLGN